MKIRPKELLRSAAAILAALTVGVAVSAIPESDVKTAYVAETPPAPAARADSVKDVYVPGFLPDLSPEESARMSNCANYQLFTEDPETQALIGRAYNHGRNALVKISDVSADPSADTRCTVEVLAEDCWLGSVQYDKASDTVYGLDLFLNGAMVAVKDGEVTELPCEVHTYCLDPDGVIYYVDSDTMYLRRYVPGAETSQAVLNIRMDCPFIIDGHVVCVSLDEGNGIWVYSLDGSYEECLVAESASCPIIEGNRLFYLSDTLGCICMKDLETGETEVYETLKTYYTFFLTDEYICLYDGDGENGAVLVNRGYMKIGEVDPLNTFYDAYVRLEKSWIIGCANGVRFAGVALTEDGNGISSFWEKSLCSEYSSIEFFDVSKPDTILVWPYD